MRLGLLRTWISDEGSTEVGWVERTYNIGDKTGSGAGRSGNCLSLVPGNDQHRDKEDKNCIESNKSKLEAPE
jgi:hypothetical protein